VGIVFDAGSGAWRVRDTPDLGGRTSDPERPPPARE
jgi:hypothetical protein